MTATKENIETVLSQSIPRGHIIDKVIVGFNWSLVRSKELCGIARSPSRNTEGARTIRPAQGFKGMDLADLATYLRTTDPLARSVGLAAVNAYWNKADANYNERVPIGGFSGLEAPGDGVVIIGGFRGALKRLPNARIVEREPKESNDIPESEAASYIAKAQTLAITAQTLMNNSLNQILDDAQNVPHRILVGPSAPLCPLLLKYGLHEISAAVIQNADAAEEFICETGTMIMLDHIAKSVYLRYKK